MSRLATEFQRLYAAAPDGASRSLVLDIGRPSDWELTGALWRGVQLDLGLPAPGIVIAGENSYQLWFSLAQGCSTDEAMRFFDGLRARYLGDIAGPRIRTLTTPPQVPAQVKEDQWSAFVASDLAPVFVEATWLDIPPGGEGQADLLKGLKSVSPQEWAAALAQLGGTSQDLTLPVEITSATAGPVAPAFASATAFTDPRDFLMHVMNDATVPMALRIEAAKGLLAASDCAAR